jgi:hypothetical protein
MKKEDNDKKGAVLVNVVIGDSLKTDQAPPAGGASLIDLLNPITTS